MPACIDTTKAHLSRAHGDLTAIYTWINGERCIAILQHTRVRPPTFVVMESRAYQYDDPLCLQQSALDACRFLGLDPALNWYRIAKIIHEGLPELVAMPSEPSWERKKREFGEMVVKQDGQEIAREALVIEDKGPEYVPA